MVGMSKMRFSVDASEGYDFHASDPEDTDEEEMLENEDYLPMPNLRLRR